MNGLMRKFLAGLFAVSALTSIAPALANMGADDSDSSDPSFVDGRKAVEAQDWNKAVEFLEKAVRADPNNADAHNFLGYAYRKKGTYMHLVKDDQVKERGGVLLEHVVECLQGHDVQTARGREVMAEQPCGRFVWQMLLKAFLERLLHQGVPVGDEQDAFGLV